MSARPDSPLVVDLDGTLTFADTLFESIVVLAKKMPVFLLFMPFLLLRGRAYLKEWIALRVDLPADSLPYRQDLLEYLRSEKERGRKIILATAAHQSIALNVSAHLGLFDQVLASSSALNLKGKAKLQAIQVNVGEDFVYAGDSKADLPIWASSGAAILVGLSASTARSARSLTKIECEFPKQTVTLRDWLRAIRMHQWMKNLLLFVPILTAFSFLEIEKVIAITVSFFAFSLAASATYIANDLWDLQSDRHHPRKRLRPFASAKISIPIGITVAALFLVVAFSLATFVSYGFVLMLLIYVFLTTFYSLVLKSYVLLDVIMLSVLYTFRILTGSIAIGVSTSSWLLVFSVFVFLSLEHNTWFSLSLNFSLKAN